MIENEKFWHLKPKLLERINYHSTMEPLQQLLGDGVEASYIAKCNPREQLILCYILANSMLYLYPSSWLQLEWCSSMVYFVRQSTSSTAPILTCPYVSVELQNGSKLKEPTHHMQYHTHPAILALGIIFLEIATGTRFKRTREESPWKQCNKDNGDAWRLFNVFEREDRHRGTKKLSSGLSKAIRACLKLEPPPNFPSNHLSDEGPIRHYILSCIVWPLAHELEQGYKVSLVDLHKSLVADVESEDIDDISGLKGVSRRSTVSFERRVQMNKNSKDPIIVISPENHAKITSQESRFQGQRAFRA